tara:strand:+ start:5710 stop:6519 length:810 start_codon:yes stop_codon:yes gene_type:complete
MYFYWQTFLKDLRIATSYKVQFLFSVISIFISIFFIFIFSSLFESADNQILNKYGGSYFNFLFIGFITAEITFLFLNTMPNKVREYQMTGVFEELIMSGRKEIEVILSSLLYPIFFQIFRLFCYWIALVLSNIDLVFLNGMGISSLIAFLLFSISLIGISLLSTAITIIYKSPGIINRIYLSVSSILSGVAFPVELLPRTLEVVGQILPTTQFLNIIRADSVNIFDSISSYYENFLFLLILAVTFLIFGILSLRKAIKIAKTNGSLLLY